MPGSPSTTRGGDLGGDRPGRPRIRARPGRPGDPGKVNPKAAGKLAPHRGGAVLQGKLVAEGSKLNLLDADFTWIEPKAEAAMDGGAK